MNKRTQIIIVILILIIATLPRFYNLINQGFISWDEGMYMNEALFYRSVIGNIFEITQKIINKTIDSEYLIKTLQGWPPSSAKPLHGLFIYLFSLFLGLNVYTSKFVSAFFGVLTVGLIFILMRSWYDAITGIIASLFLATSGYFIYISRLGVPETNSIFFFILGLYLYEKSIKRDKGQSYTNILILCGLSLGISLTLCYRWIIAIPIIWLLELFNFFPTKHANKKITIKRILLLTISFIFIPLLCDMPFWPLRFVSNFSVKFQHIPQDISGYFDQLLFYLNSQSHHGKIYPHTLYVKFLSQLNSIPITVISFIGIFILLKRHKIKDILITFPPIIVFTMLSLKTRGNSLRYISLALPFFSATAAIAYISIIRLIRLKNRGSIIVVTIITIALSGLSMSKVADLLTIKSGYEDAMVYLKENKGERNLSTSNAYFEYYFGRNVSEQIPPKLEGLEKILKEGKYKFIVMDFMSHRVIRKETKDFIETKFKPIIRIKNQIGDNYFTLIESMGYRHLIKDYIKNALNDEHASYIEIYNAREVLDTLSLNRHARI